jgi:hypothetical protein
MSSQLYIKLTRFVLMAACLIDWVVGWTIDRLVAKRYIDWMA